MRAAVYRRYGSPDVVSVEEVPTPTPAADEILVRNRASTIGAADSAARRGVPLFSRLFFGLRRPRWQILGSEFAGQVAAVGPAVTRFRIGDEIVGITGPDFGGHAEYLTVSEAGAVMRKPAGIAHTDAAALADGTALAFLRDEAGLRPGQSILINGAAGSVGSMAVQLAKHVGATVTAVCSTGSVHAMTRLGADRVIDRTRQDFTREDRSYDVVFDAVGKSSFARCRRCLAPDGVYLSTVPSLPLMLRLPWFGSRRAKVAFTGLRPTAEKTRDLHLVMALADAGDIVAVIDGRYPLERIVEAHARVDTGRKTGTVVVTMGESS
ncbi:NAD(P)-dependent alcohol dehydrogenase [Compostimonas suwonensis]|uniref:NADPH:quinone reductase-like Zn-dependent oxidoreductase n=1 Tax=Compostimonas suwonensis TaxID=1048394 RepID=A0A2M9BWJ6_9MICO|nr:NAD(P)-dependent alcohol dehydrogenase [Compostimonas suwonensis]PJJ62299.1 NADPH:quinone reductase-like Zn-dependent oxidoreductase [Compostimonas suwonensis]